MDNRVVQSISPGMKFDPNAPGMREVMEWFLQQQGGQLPPMQGVPVSGKMDEAQKQQILIQLLREQAARQQQQPPVAP